MYYIWYRGRHSIIFLDSRRYSQRNAYQDSHNVTCFSSGHSDCWSLLVIPMNFGTLCPDSRIPACGNHQLHRLSYDYDCDYDSMWPAMFQPLWVCEFMHITCPKKNWLVVCNMFYSPIYWKLSFQLTFIFLRGIETTNQICIDYP